MRDHLSWERLGAVSQDRFHCTHVTACHLAPSVTRPDLTQYHGSWKIHGIKNNVIREGTYISVTNNKSQDICDKYNNQRLLLWPWHLADSGTPHERLPHKAVLKEWWSFIRGSFENVKRGLSSAHEGFHCNNRHNYNGQKGEVSLPQICVWRGCSTVIYGSHTVHIPTTATCLI
jgi:hypothetical protein